MSNKAYRLLAVIVLMLIGAQARAIVITPADCNTTMPGGNCWIKTDYPAYNNPDAADVITITGVSGIFELYKDDAGGSESGSFSGSYETTYAPDEAEAEDALIEYVGGDAINCATCFLLVKDGNHNPGWYLFDISSWNGMDDLDLQDFWIGGGAISHVTLFGKEAQDIPEPGILALLGAGLFGLGIRRLKKRTHN